MSFSIKITKQRISTINQHQSVQILHTHSKPKRVFDFGQTKQSKIHTNTYIRLDRTKTLF